MEMNNCLVAQGVALVEYASTTKAVTSEHQCGTVVETLLVPSRVRALKTMIWN